MMALVREQQYFLWSRHFTLGLSWPSAAYDR